MKNQELHLLYVFDAIMTERSVTRAADRLAMTQPAVSNAISRMRQVWNDPLFVRKGRQIEPTSYAFSLWDRIRGPIYDLSTAVSSTTFDPSQAKRTFRIAVSDIITDMIWGELAEVLEREAPGVDLHAVPYTPEGTYADLREANVDLAIGLITQHDHSLRSIWLFQGGYQLAMRSDHPLAGKPVSLDDFLNARHLLVSLSGDAHGFVDSYLDQKGLSRRVAVTVNEFVTVPSLLKRTDLICAVPDILVGCEEFRDDLSISPLPFELDPTSLYLMWHARHDRDPGIVWIRELIEDLLKERHSSFIGAAA
ncbi:LysR family transcriptional regulator [Marinobacter arenosus]|uniref:LysR family transcriptional regulator n=1 Tax=Marinobacter arenosus TaxID=2856822 RepID=UPI001C4C3393|nr:LysR family transcriptional regulator [Marinobacter arenosus]MBW0146190.1 LysR family transcriptional regulator [Marinobacter arenosus]